MASAIITGRDAYVNGVPCTTSWAVNRAGSNARYFASCTGRGSGVTNGNIAETGSVSGLGGEPPAAVMPGTQSTFKGVIDNTLGSAKVLDGTVLFSDLTITCNKEGSAPITWVANFGVQGELVPGTTGAADATFLEHKGASDVADPQILDGGANYVIPGFRGWSITLRNPSASFIQSSLTQYRPGNLEADISIDVYSDEMYNPKFAINVIDKVKLFTSPTLFWHFGYIKFSALSGFIVDRSSNPPALVGYTINGMWSAVQGTTQGHITKPSGVLIYP